MRERAVRYGAAVVLTGAGLQAAAAAGLPWRWALPALAVGGAGLLASVLRRGRGGGAACVVAVLALAACAVLPGGHLRLPWALATAAALVAHLAALEAYGGGGVPRQAGGALAFAAVAAALVTAPAADAAWLLPVGLLAVVAAFAAATAGIVRSGLSGARDAVTGHTGRTRTRRAGEGAHRNRGTVRRGRR